jgi:subtilisin-like proprotein convertase family protein
MRFLRSALYLSLYINGLGSYASANILPPNDWHKYDRLTVQANMTQDEFNQLIDQVLDLYEPVINAHGAELVRNKLWEDPTVNASASQEPSRWIVNMYGGLARRPEVTPDGFVLVVCHELGHHLGGFPLKGERWAATEGQADYFATQACARALWQNQFTDNASFRLSVHPEAQAQCDSVWNEVAEQDLCYRISAASQSLANLLAAIGGSSSMPDFSTPDAAQVERTYEAHPAAQCRLDTYMNGATCVDQFDANFIPGKSHPEGQSSTAAELQAANHSCMQAKGQVTGLRSRCWFKPRLPFMALFPESNSWIENEGNGSGAIDPGDMAGLRIKISNRTDTPVQDVRIHVQSDHADLTILKAQADIGLIEPGASRESNAVVKAKLSSSAVCGTKIPVQVLATSNRGSSVTEAELTVGEMRHDSAGNNPTPVEILNSAVVYSDIDSSVNVAATRAVVSVNITHSYSSDVILSLVAPDGSTTVVARLPRIPSGQIEASYPVELKGQSSLGLWRLKVEDTYRLDSGFLNSWGLELESYTCQ